MAIINHLKLQDARNIFRTISYGRHVVTGVLAKSSVTGTSPTHQIYLQQALGAGEWAGLDASYWNNLSIAPADIVFHPGKLSSGNNDALQGVDTIFSDDVPHSLVPWVRVKLPEGVGEFDQKTSPALGFQGFFRTKVINDYNNLGAVTGYSYSVNPARIVADLILKQGRRAADIIDWQAWVEWRDFLQALILCDYTALPGFDGFGLTATYYSGTAFNTLHSSRIDTLVNFPLSPLSPAYNLDANSFSARFEGKIKAKFSETFTFALTYNDGARLWVNDVLLIDAFAGPSATATGTIALSANQFYNIKIEWQDSAGDAELLLKWSSPSQPIEIVPSKYLYPKPVFRPRYEAHPFFSTRTRLDEAVRTVLALSNSTYQKVNGKYRFFCFEQLTASSYAFTENEILEITLKPRDKANLRNRFTATFRDIDSRFLEQNKAPFVVERRPLQTLAGRTIDGDDIEFFNMSRWQAWRLLNTLVARAIDTLPIEVLGNASTFPVLAGDRVRLTSEIYNFIAKEFLVLTSNDASAEDTADERNFSMIEWL